MGGSGGCGGKGRVLQGKGGYLEHGPVLCIQHSEEKFCVYVCVAKSTVGQRLFPLRHAQMYFLGSFEAEELVRELSSNSVSLFVLCAPYAILSHHE